MLTQTWIRHLTHRHNNHSYITHTQAQQLKKLPLDTLLRRLQSSSLTNPARSLEAHFQLLPTPDASPATPGTAMTDSLSSPCTSSEQQGIALRTALSDALTLRAEWMDAPGRHADQRTRLSVEEWGLLAGNAIRHGLDATLTRRAVQQALTAVQNTYGRHSATVGTEALVRVLEACVDGEMESTYTSFGALPLEALNSLVVAVEHVWEGPRDGRRSEEADLSIFALFVEFLALVMVRVSAGQYFGGTASQGGTASTAPAATGEPRSRLTTHGNDATVSTSTSTPSPQPPVPGRRWSDRLLPHLTLTVDPHLVVTRCEQLATAMCQHLAKQLTLTRLESRAAGPRSRCHASVSEALRWICIADRLSPPSAAATPPRAVASTEPIGSSWPLAASASGVGLTRSLMPSWLPFARATPATPDSTVESERTPPLSEPSSAPPEEATGAELDPSRARLALQLRRVALAEVRLTLSGTDATPPPSLAAGPRKETATAHPLLASLPLADVATLLQLACEPALSSEEAEWVLARLAVHVASRLNQLTRGGGRGLRGELFVPRHHHAAVPEHTRRPLEDTATLQTVLAIGEAQVVWGNSRGTASVVAAVLQCIEQGAPTLWRCSHGELWIRACLLVERAPLLTRDASQRALWGLARAVAAEPSISHEHDRRHGLLSLTRLIVEEAATAKGHHAEETVAAAADAITRRAVVAAMASQTLSFPFSEHGVAGLKSAVRTLHTLTKVLATANTARDVCGADEDGAELQEVCWHAVVHTLECLQRLSSRLSSPTRPWTALLGASELSSLRHALRWASSAQTTSPARCRVPQSGGSAHSMSSLKYGVPHAPTGTGVEDTRMLSEEAAHSRPHVRRGALSTHTKTTLSKRSPSVPAARHRVESDERRVASMSDELHRQLVVS